MAYAAAWLFDITRAPRDEMYVAVKDGLPGISAAVHSDIKPCNGAVCMPDQIAAAGEQLIAGDFFFQCQFKVIHRVPFGDDQQVVLGDRVSVPPCIGIVVFQYRVAVERRTEDARFCGIFLHMRSNAEPFRRVTPSRHSSAAPA